MEWKEYQLGECLTFQRGFDITKAEQQAGKIPIISSSLLWDKSSPKALAVRRKDLSDKSVQSDPYCFRTASPEVAANTIICLINQASFLLARQLQRLEQNFLKEGGFTERMYRERKRITDSG